MVVSDRGSAADRPGLDRRLKMGLWCRGDFSAGIPPCREKKAGYEVIRALSRTGKQEMDLHVVRRTIC